MQRSLTLSRRLFASPASLPIAFALDGRPLTGIPADWNPSARRRRLDASLVETVFEGTDPATGLDVRAECIEYSDYPIVEWTAWFTNTGSRPTPILRDILALDGVFEGASPILWHCNGDFYSQDGYTASETPLEMGHPLAFAPHGGRPCDRAFPYFRLRFGDGGLSIAVGWPAQWSASFARVAGGVRVRAGQEQTHLRLAPGETVRTPRMAVMSWTGDTRRAVNLWRRWHRDHLLPRTDGRPLGPRLCAHGTGDGEEFTAATEENQLRYIEKWAAEGIPPDVWWIDAGWYPCYDRERKRRWWETGTWQPDPERFPRGLGPVAQGAARHGADLLVWFEPERVRPGSELDREHPEWLLTAKGADNRLLNLGNPTCRQWLTDHVCRLIRDNGIRIYRQDFNFEPLAHWRENDAADRQGMNENLHVQGYLQYWDDLLARNPGLWIDSCASGGRRNDLETMRRSVPLHYTDFGYGNHPVKLAFHHILFEWLPYFKESTLAWDVHGAARYDHEIDRFAWHAGLGPAIMPCISIARDDYDYALMRELVALWRRAAGPMLTGDYYPLTPIRRTPEQWVARQFDCPEEGHGFIQGLRLPACPVDTLTVYPAGLVPDAMYRFENSETGQTKDVSGDVLARDGLLLEAPRRRGVIWFYRRMDG